MRLRRGPDRDRATRRVSAEEQPVGPVAREEREAGDGVGHGVVERPLRREPVVDREHDGAERLGEPSAVAVLQVEVAEQPVPAVQEREGRPRRPDVGHVATQRHPVVRQVVDRPVERSARSGRGAVVSVAPEALDVDGHVADCATRNPSSTTRTKSRIASDSASGASIAT